MIKNISIFISYINKKNIYKIIGNLRIITDFIFILIFIIRISLKIIMKYINNLRCTEYQEFHIFLPFFQHLL